MCEVPGEYALELRAVDATVWLTRVVEDEVGIVCVVYGGEV